MGGITRYIKNKAGKFVSISEEDYWKRHHESKPRATIKTPVVRDPVIRKITKVNGKVTERRVKQSVLDAEKKAKIAAIKAADIARRAKDKATALLSDTAQSAAGTAGIRGYTKYIIGMVGIGAVALYIMRRKKR